VAETTKFQLKGLTCRACKLISERQFMKIPGVSSTNVDFESGTGEIVADRSIPSSEISNALSRTGFTLIENK